MSSGLKIVSRKGLFREQLAQNMVRISNYMFKEFVVDRFNQIASYR